MVTDYVENDGMPAQVDRRPFKVGENVAITAGPSWSSATRCSSSSSTRLRPRRSTSGRSSSSAAGETSNTSSTSPRGASFLSSCQERVHRLHRELAESDAAQRDWDLGTYVTSAHRASDAISEITGSGQLNVMGACAGGITTSVFLAHLAARGDDRFTSASFPVTMIDMADPGMIGIFTSEATLASSIRRSARREFSPARTWRGSSPGSADDLVWNYWVNNYLMGDPPPAFDSSTGTTTRRISRPRSTPSSSTSSSRTR